MKKIRLNYNYDEIKLYEIIKETDKQVIYKQVPSNNAEIKEYKRSSCSSWHDTIPEAILYAEDSLSEKIKIAEIHFNFIKTNAEETIKNLKLKYLPVDVAEKGNDTFTMVIMKRTKQTAK